MRFLLDEMHTPTAAERLRFLGVDAVAVVERPEWAGLADEELLRVAAADRRVLVTENVKDFAVIARRWAATGTAHGGLVFTHPRRFPRAASGHARRLADALCRLGDDVTLRATHVESFVWWL